MKGTLIELLSDSVKRFPEKDAIVQNDMRLSYSKLWEGACGLASYLISNGLNYGNRVALLIENSPEYVISYYGVLMAGGCVVSLNTSAKARDITNWMAHSDSVFIIAHGKHPEVNDVLQFAGLNQIKSILINGDNIKYDHDKFQDITHSDNHLGFFKNIDSIESHASIIYTSGTTGKPKGVLLSHKNMYSNIQSILSYLKLSESDSLVNILPFYYSYGNSVLHTHLAVGATLYLENSLLYPRVIVSLMSNKRVTGFSGVPSTYNLLLNRVNFKEFDLSSLRYMTQAGGPMPPALIDRVRNEFPAIDFYIMYGQTEASARLSYLPPELLIAKMGSIGKAIPEVELVIMDNNHQILPANVIGEIYAKGESIMLGYWKDEEATSQVMYKNWLKTGDLAYKDDDGYIYIVGRSSEMIKSGANRISPNDIEDVILELNGVEEVAVVGISDDLLGQAIKAVIVKTPGSTVDKMQIMHHCKLNLANYKLPKHIEFVDSIPRTASGKVQRFMLQQ